MKVDQINLSGQNQTKSTEVDYNTILLWLKVDGMDQSGPKLTKNSKVDQNLQNGLNEPKQTKLDRRGLKQTKRTEVDCNATLMCLKVDQMD